MIAERPREGRGGRGWIVPGVPRRGAIALLASLALASCGDSPSGPGGDLRIEILSGSAQEGLAGWPLDEALVVRVTDTDGNPVQGVSVNFTAIAGHGVLNPVTVTTSASGWATSSWTLGPSGSGTESASATLPGGASATFDAIAFGPDRADVVVVHGALGPLTGFAVVQEGAFLELLGSLRQADTILHVPPSSAPGREVIIFAGGNRPKRVDPRWTPSVDTAHVTLEAPVAVDIRFAVRAGNFAARRLIMLEQLEAMEGLWRVEGAGLVLGTVTFTDSTASGQSVHLSSAGICSGLTPGNAIQVDLVTTIDNGQYTGWGCWAGKTFMAEGTETFPYLLAHELGHTFTLEHTATGMMFPSQPQLALREGEIYRAHFHIASSLNRSFASQPTTQRRTCINAPASFCLPETFDLGAGVIALAAGRGPQAVDRRWVGHYPAWALDPNPTVTGRPVDGVGRVPGVVR